jgi:flagellar hook-associated protein 1 FlgK
VGSTFFGLEIGRKGIQAQQLALNITGHNIANANTPGFSRQVGIMVTSYPDNVPSLNRPAMHGLIGTGVIMNDIVRVRNEFYDRQFWDQNIDLGRWEERRNQLSKLELVLNEGSEAGLSSVYDMFWQSWQELVKKAENETYRTVVRDRGIALADTLNEIYAQLKGYRQELNQTLIIKKDEINNIARQLGELNGQIQDLEITGSQANDLRDKRDLLLDQLSKIVNIRVQEGSRGLTRVSIGDYDLVDGLTVNQLTVKARAQAERGVIIHDLYWAGTGEKLTIDDRGDIRGGELRSIIEIRDGDTTENSGIPYYIRQLDMMTYQTIRRINEYHRAGYGLNKNQVLPVKGGEGVNWEVEFGAGTVTAGRYKIEITDSAGNFKVSRYNDNPAPNAITGTWEVVGTGGPLGTGTDFTDGGLQLKSTIGPTGFKSGDTWEFSVVIDQDESGNPLDPRLGGPNFFNEINLDDLNSVITLNSLLTGDEGLKRIAASLIEGKEGNGDNALRIAQLKHDLVMGDQEASFNDFIRSVAGKLGVDTQEAIRVTENQALLVQQIDNLRQGVSSVSLDEEMTNMVKFQHAYNASSRLITTIDEMIDVIVNRMGLVGRS